MFKKIGIALLLITNLQSHCWFWPFSVEEVPSITCSGMDSQTLGCVRVTGPVNISGQGKVSVGMGSEFQGPVRVTGQGRLTYGVGTAFRQGMQTGSQGKIKPDYSSLIYPTVVAAGGICLLGFLANSYRK